MPLYIFDTSTIISYRITEIPDNFLLAAVVIGEWMAGAKDEKILRALIGLRNAHAKANTLLVPDADDWLEAGKVLCRLTHLRRKKAGGKLPPLRPGASQRMFLDALLALSSRKAGATIITVNYDDFAAIQYYYRGLKIIRASAYFGYQP